jgi:hypothetical protein
MKRQWALKPNLIDCLLEERVAPAIANFGIIVLTTSGYALVTPFPGASNSAAGSLGSSSTGSSTAASVSGAAMPTSFYITGARGISSFTPGNFTGNPNVGGGPAGGTSGGVSLSIQVGSGAEDAAAPVVTTSVSRLNVGSDGSRPTTLAYIGQPASGSGAPILPEGESYRAPTAPVPTLPPMGVVIPGTPMGPGTSPGATSNPFSPQGGAPRLLPGGMSSGMGNSLPGGLGVGMDPLPRMPGR